MELCFLPLFSTAKPHYSLALVTWLRRPGVANTSIAIDRSIVECQLVDRAWFCIELTRYLTEHFSISIPFYGILYLWLYYRPFDRESSRNFLVEDKLATPLSLLWQIQLPLNIMHLCVLENLHKHHATVFLCSSPSLRACLNNLPAFALNVYIKIQGTWWDTTIELFS